MARGVIDLDGIRSPEGLAIQALKPPAGLPFRIGKIGHVVLKVRDVQRSAAFYVNVLGFRVSDYYPDSMMKGRMVFMRCNADHHGVALVGGGEAAANGGEMHHMAFEVATLEEVFQARAHLKANGVKVEFEGRRRAGCQIAVEFRDPDGHWLEIYWGLDQIGTNGAARPPGEWREAFSLEEAIGSAPPGQDTTRPKPPGAG
jgi:catechol 2,3-dioxygenase-like lactoylglutathione lyase family enzyme